MSIPCLTRRRQRRRQRRFAESSVKLTTRSPRQRATRTQRRANLHPWVAKDLSRLQCHR